ncbi:MAG: FAD-dependent oxidoreductase [Candidatus Woesearchaeota archaeon]
MDDVLKYDVVILGAGPAGLAAGYKLRKDGKNVLILEKDVNVGGSSKSVRKDGVILDYGPHAFHFKNQQIMDFVKEILDEEYVVKKRDIKVLLKGKFFDYPLRITEPMVKLNPFLTLRMLFDYFIAFFVYLHHKIFRIEEKSFEEWGKKYFGNTLYKLCFGDYSERVWGISPKKLSVKLAQQKITNLNIFNIILEILGIDIPSKRTYHKEYIYPPSGISILFERLAEKYRSIGGEIATEANIEEINTGDGKVRTLKYSKDGKTFNAKCSYLISTIPLKYLIPLITQNLSKEVIEEIKELKYRDLRLVNILINKERFSKSQWIYFLDNNFISNRVSEQKNLSEKTCPTGKTVLCFEICCNQGDEIWNMSDKEIYQVALKDFKNLGLGEELVDKYFVLNLKDAYPIYTIDFDIKLNNIIENLSNINNLFSIGRQGLFLNNDMHDSMEMGFMSASFVMDGSDSKRWYTEVEKYAKHKLEGKEAPIKDFKL